MNLTKIAIQINGKQIQNKPNTTRIEEYQMSWISTVFQIQNTKESKISNYQ